jgi:hypothetical protein
MQKQLDLLSFYYDGFDIRDKIAIKIYLNGEREQ